MTGPRRGRTAALTGLVLGVIAIGFWSLPEAPPTPPAPPPPPTLPEGRIRVEVLNQGGVSGMAREATGVLRDVGFDVVDFGNAAAFDPERPSVVVDRVGRPELAAAVAEVLGIDNVRSEPDPNLYVDVTVLLGSEWAAPLARSIGPDDRARAWWDPRGWLRR